MSNLFENLQLMKEYNNYLGTIFMNKDNHTLQFIKDINKSVGRKYNNLPHNRMIISKDKFNKCSNSGNTIDLLDFQNPYNIIEYLFSDKPELIKIMKNKLDKYIYEQELNIIQKDNNECSECGSKLNDQGECP